MSRGRTLVALAAAAGVLAAPAPAAAQLKLRACDHVRCGRIAGAARPHAAPCPGRVSLYVERQAARRRPARGVTLLLAGGPGQPATRAYDDGTKDPYGEFRAMAPSNDVVVFDGRGTGRSGLLRCPELERASLVDAGAEAAACARRLGTRRGFYRTSDSVEDIEAVRAALGVERLTLLGVSYGTYLAQAYAARYPTRVERVLLDSVLDSWDPFYLDVFAAIPRVLRQVCRIALQPVHRGRGRRPQQARRAAREGAAARQGDAAERPPPQRHADPGAALLHAGRGRPQRDPAGRVPGRRDVRAARRPGADAAPRAPRERGRGRRLAARLQLRPLRRDRLRGDPIPVDALLAARLALRADRRRRRPRSRGRRSTPSTRPPTPATTSCACAGAGRRRRRRRRPRRPPVRCRTCRC